jgi:hypothetical protein
VIEHVASTKRERLALVIWQDSSREFKRGKRKNEGSNNPGKRVLIYEFQIKEKE